MANFDDFKQKAKILAKTTRLNADIVKERSNVRRLYSEIGKAYYKMHKDFPEPALIQDCAEVTASLDRIAANKAAIEELKQSGNVTDDEIEVEIIAEDENQQDD